VNTFLISDDWNETARALDTRRLGRQIQEVYELASVVLRHELGQPAVENMLTGLSIPQIERLWTAYQHHPVVRMWVGHSRALVEYGQACADEWQERQGIAHLMGAKIEKLMILYGEFLTQAPPLWQYREELYKVHRGVLLWKGRCDAAIIGWKDAPGPKRTITVAQWQKRMQELKDTAGSCAGHYDSFGWAEDAIAPDDHGRFPYRWPQGIGWRRVLHG